ncbi:hypothetical protein MTO96_050363, partial [Rhipicephalus appendiculatus]
RQKCTTSALLPKRKPSAVQPELRLGKPAADHELMVGSDSMVPEAHRTDLVSGLVRLQAVYLAIFTEIGAQIHAKDTYMLLP